MATTISVLDLCPVGEDFGVKQAFENSVSLAQVAEENGYHRVWYAEHHNMPGIASSATSVLIDHIANHTKTIRVGSGGIMLPNHSPLTIAEQFGTLAQLHGDRIDLGVGRAPGTDPKTMRALRRNMHQEDTFPQDVMQLLSYFDEPKAGEILATPAANTHVPVWILGSSNYGATLAANLGLPYSFASHFAPEMLEQALYAYHSHFKPSKYLQKPYVMLAVNVVLAETQEEAEYQFTSSLKGFLGLIRGQRGEVQKPTRDMDSLWNDMEKELVQSRLKYSYVGTPQKVKNDIKQLAETYKVDELMITQNIYDQKTRENTLKLFKELNL
ncbi:MsnO8 family LLM class oxidoreductase [Neisseriaceae bacterium PsAf]|nr:MsnO8 family LLM class oxidoreductase [Neisseriaceae bacterium PsAf]